MKFLLCTTLLFGVTSSWVKREGYDVTSQYGHYCQNGKIYVALPWDCNGFIQCTQKSDGSFFAKWMPCAWHLQYNSVKHTCDYGRGSCTNMTNVALENCEMNPDLMFADPDHCAMYYDCKQTQPLAGLNVYQNECPYPQLFDEGKQKCEPPSLVNCNRRYLPVGKCDYKLGCDSTFCLNKTDGRYPVPGEEFGNEFIICTNNKISQGVCPGATQVFDPVKLECTSLDADSVGKFCKSVGTAVFEDKSKCSQFYDCSKQRHHESMKDYQTECPYPMLFDTQKKKCRPYYLVTCALRPVPVKPCDYKYGRCIGVEECIPCEASCAPDDVGAFSHPFDEFKYVTCKDGRTTEILPCPLGKMFDAKLRQCIQKCNCAAEIQALALMIKAVEHFLQHDGLLVHNWFIKGRAAMSCDKPVQNILKQMRQTTRRGANLMSCHQHNRVCPSTQSLSCSAGRVVGTWNPSEQPWCSQKIYHDVNGLSPPINVECGDPTGGLMLFEVLPVDVSKHLIISLEKDDDVLIQMDFDVTAASLTLTSISEGHPGPEMYNILPSSMHIQANVEFTIELKFSKNGMEAKGGRNILFHYYPYVIPAKSAKIINWNSALKINQIRFYY